MIKPNLPGLTVYEAIVAGVTADADVPTTVAEDGVATAKGNSIAITAEPMRVTDIRDFIMICSNFLVICQLREG